MEGKLRKEKIKRKKEKESGRVEAIETVKKEADGGKKERKRERHNYRIDS